MTVKTPEPILRINDNDEFKRYLTEILRDVVRTLDPVISLPSFTVATLPTPSDNPTGLAICSDEVGGTVPCFSDGTNWRRVTDRAIAS